MNVLPDGFTPPIGMRRTITDECLGMWAFSSVYSAKYDHYKTNINIHNKNILSPHITKTLPIENPVKQLECKVCSTHR